MLHVRCLWLSALSLAVFAVPLTLAQGSSRVAIVNVEEILSEATPVRAAIDRIDREVSRRVREIEQRDTTLTEMVETYQAQSSLWSDEVRAQQQREIIDGNMELRELERSLREFQEVSEDTVIAPTFERITEAIRQIAEESDLDAVLRSDAAVFAKPELNLTDRVIDRLNAMDPPEFNTPEPVEETP